MNGVRTTFMRRGYLLTALSALLLLAASAGTASAQITVDVPKTVNEGDTATVTVNASGYVPPGDGETDITVTVTVGPGTAQGSTTVGGGDDYNAGLLVSPRTFDIPANRGPGRARYSESLTFQIATLQDLNAEDEALAVTVTVDGRGGLLDSIGGTTTEIALRGIGTPHPLVIDDDEMQTYKLTLVTEDPTEGAGAGGAGDPDAIAVTLTAVPPHNDGRSGPLTLDIPGPISPSPATANIGVGGEATGTSADIMITYPHDKNRVADTITLTAYSGNAVSSDVVASLPITVKDDDQLPKVDAVLVDENGRHLDPQPTSVEEGSEIDVVFRVLSAPDPATGRRNPLSSRDDEALTIQLDPTGDADSADYSLVREIKIGSTRVQSERVTLEVVSDEDVGMETLAFDAIVSGDKNIGPETETTSNVLSLMIEDGTAKKIWTKSEDDAYPKITEAIEAGAGDDGLNPGESFMINTSDLFGYAEGYTASFGAASDSDAVSVSASGSTVTAMAESAGSAKVTITGTATMASSSFAPAQTVSNVASVTFEVMVVDKPLTLMIEMPDNVMEGNIVEGMSYHIPVKTNRAVNEDTEVTFARDRSQSDADEDDYSIGDVTIMAGEHMAMAELMVTEDMMDDAGHAMGEQLVIYAMAGDVESDELMFTIWDEAVPALPLIAQLLLALFLMAGGARLYRRRQG